MRPPVCVAARLDSASRKTPHHQGKAPQENLLGIFTISLAGTVTWQWSWASQILSALAWAQVGMLSDYPCMVVMRALHKAVRRVCAASPWYAEHIMHPAYAVGHHLPCARKHARRKLFHWLKANAVWEGDLYTDAVIRDGFRPEGYTPVRCHNAGLLRRLSNLCVCAVGWEHPTRSNCTAPHKLLRGSIVVGWRVMVHVTRTLCTLWQTERRLHPACRANETRAPSWIPLLWPGLGIGC